MPRWDHSLTIDGITFYRDHRNEQLFHYPPAPLDLYRDRNGVPGISISIVNYQGTSSRGDSGRKIERGILSIRLAAQKGYVASVLNAERKLRQQYGSITVRPIVPETSHLSFTLEEMLGDGGLNLDATFARLEDEDDQDGNSSSYWGPAPTATLSLSPEDAIIVKDALRDANLFASITFDFQSTGIEPSAEDGRLAEDARTVQSDSIPLYVDDQYWEDVYSYVDLNELAPPDYPLLSVICFDFAWGRDDLELKVVDIRAKSPGVGWVYAQAAFSISEPEVSSAEIRFRHAVEMDQPPEYRISEISIEGDEFRSEWRVAASWEWLDVSELQEPSS
jgi:hypothetical protein